MADVRCPKCGGKTGIRISKKDNRKYHVCVNSPRCKGKISLGVDWGDDWDKEIPVPKHKVTPEKKEPPKTRTQMAHKKKDRSEPQQQIMSKADTAPEEKGPPKLRQRRMAQSYLAPERKKRSMTVIIIVLVVAFLAIDGMIYAVLVLR